MNNLQQCALLCHVWHHIKTFFLPKEYNVIIIP